MPTKERRARERQRAQEGTVTFKVPVETEPETEPTAQEAEAQAEVDEADDEATGEAQARISRIDAATGHKNYLGWVTPSLVNNRWLMETLGGGDFRVAFFVPSGKDGRLVHQKTRTYHVDPSIPAKTPPWARATEPISGPVSGPDTRHSSSVVDSQLVSLFTMQQQSFRESIESARKDREMQNMMLQAWLERMANGSKPSTDWVELAKIFGPQVLKSLGDRRDPLEIARELTETITKATTRAPEPPSALTDALALMDRLDARFRRNNPAAPAAEADDSLVGFLKTAFPEVLATFRQTLAARSQAAALAARNGGTVPTGNGAAATAPTPAAPVLGATMVPASPPSLPSPAASTAPAAAASAPLAPPTTVPDTGPSGDAMIPAAAWAPFVKAFVPTLIAYAANGREPEIYAVVLLDTIDAEGRLPVAEPLLMDPKFPAKFLEAFPEAVPHTQWFVDLFAAVRRELTEEPDADGDGEAVGEDETA